MHDRVDGRVGQRGRRGQPDAQASGAASGGGGERLGGRRRPGRVAELVAGEQVEDLRGLGDGARQHAVGDQELSSPSSGASEMRPRWGLRPTRPQQAAGMRVEPPPSLAWAIGTIPDGDRRRRAAAGAARRALRVPRVARGAEAARLGDRQDPVLGQRRRADDDEPRVLAGGATTLWSNGATKSPMKSAANVSRLPSTGAVVLDRDRDARRTAARRPAPMPSAAASASSPKTSTNALSCGLSASMRSSEAWTSSRAESSPDRTLAASSVTGRNSRSAAAVSGTGRLLGATGDGVARPAYSGAGCPAGLRRRVGSSTACATLCGHEHDRDRGPERPRGRRRLRDEIAEPDKAGGALRYRGVDIEDLVGHVPYEQVWGLLVDGSFEPGMPPAEPHPLLVRSGDHRVDVQAALAMLAPEWGFGR